MCAQAQPNIAILPAAKLVDHDLGYVLTPQTTLQSWPMGGHYRFDLRDEQTGEAQPLARSCINIGLEPGKPYPEALVVTHIVGDTPTEVHVFTMLAAKLPLFVITTGTGKIWAVEMNNGRARARLVDQTAGAPKP